MIDLNKNWEIINKTNREINQEITYQSDIETWGVTEKWDYPKNGYEDCDGYALEKRKRLIKFGLPWQDLRLSVVKTENNVGHLILYINTDEGGYVLDNRYNHVWSWNKLPYTWIKIQDKNGKWVKCKT